MKTKKTVFLLLSLILIMGCSSCRTVNTNKNGIPPGQMKKITGSKSAAPYAPGHNK
ncbi:hypothetical protein [Dysgonomonas sp. 521]|uniref:hypothetical protein n=1 Tax=Dysgonomonas sp. 521 TaxID=2302932 RepID=UPI001623943B|nr:hypothetical protein [Dysgonomonas sp. 521]